MQIKFDEKKTLHILHYYKKYQFEVADINNIYISYNSFLIFKKYYLNIHFKTRKFEKFHFYKNDKEAVKNAIFIIRSIIFLSIKS